MHRTLFLDFDGVLHPAPYELIEVDDQAGALGAGNGKPRARPVSLPPSPPFVWLPILESLLAPHTDVRLVVHSTWRQVHSSEEIGAILDTLEDRYLGVTEGADRWGSIQAWVAQHGVQDFRILDDYHPAFGSPLPPELIACPPITGISDARVQAALQAWLDRS